MRYQGTKKYNRPDAVKRLTFTLFTFILTAGCGQDIKQYREAADYI